MHLNIEEFELENQGNCAYDSLTLTDSGDGSSVSLCGSDVAGYDYVSLGNVMTVAFHTDYSVTYQGFLMCFDAAEAPAASSIGIIKCLNNNTNI